MLEINLKLPEGRSPDQAAMRLVRDGKDWIAENYAYQSGDMVTLYLPDLHKNERVEFSIGWENAAFAHYDVVALLTTDQVYSRPILERCVPETFPQTVKEECDKWLAGTGEAANGAPYTQSMKDQLYNVMTTIIGKAFCVNGYEQ